MATYNRAHLIVESLDSIKNQSFLNWECIIVDDGSMDNTKEVVDSFIRRDSRYKYMERSEKYIKGLPGCRNCGLDSAIGEYVIFFDDDDIVHPENLSVCYKFLKESGLDFCHYKKQSFTKDIEKFDSVPNEITKYTISYQQLTSVVTNEIGLASCTVMWKRNCFDRIKFIEHLKYAEEWECYIRILLNGYTGVGINAILYYNRKHPNSNTGEFWKGNQDRRESYIIAIKYVIENLIKQRQLSRKLIRYFIRLSVFLKNRELLKYVLLKSGLKPLVKFKYNAFYILYPVLIMGYRFKRYLKNIKY
jgi:GalNAc5-diNAcBac-PP-undecaprenol beta-1,3-glucosyltransferase